MAMINRNSTDGMTNSSEGPSADINTNSVIDKEKESKV
jgi:hypothetical protein